VPIKALLVISFVLGAAFPASAQIYTWRDPNGHLVLSNIKRSDGTEAKTFAVPRAATIRTTRQISADSARQYDALIAENARLNGIREDLVRAVVQVESAFNPYARSVKGAMGLMQLMPATIRQFGVVNPFDPADNVRAGSAYLRQLLDRYDSDETLALAAYNAGPGAVDSHGQSVPPYPETRNYVSRVARVAGTERARPGTHIYKIIETIDGRQVVRYTDRKPR
jgi:soluble lytic murein transglycosylase-like protein